MQNENAIIISDAHLGQVPLEAEQSLHRFLAEIPDRTRHLIINGDLFEFWFEYRSVIPRRTFRTLSLLRRITDSGVRLTVLGGNHDRWGRDFWPDEIGAEFHRNGVTTDVAGWRTFLHHGDGLIESERGARWLHRITRWRLTEATFRALHPDFGFKIISRLSHNLADRKRPPEEIEALTLAQTEYARSKLEASDDLELVVFGHTHNAVNKEFSTRKRFVNPGAWYDGGLYVEVTLDDIKLMSYNELSTSI